MFDSEFCLSLGPQPLETLDRFWCSYTFPPHRRGTPAAERAELATVHLESVFLTGTEDGCARLHFLASTHATVGSRCSAAHRSTSCLFDPDPLVALLLAAHGWLPDAIHEKKQ